MKWIRRQLFRWAFKGCKADDLAALEYAETTIESAYLEDKGRIRDALVLAYFAEKLRK